jgi:hypothetical protein
MRLYIRQVLQQWMTAARTPRTVPQPREEEEDGKDDCPVARKKAKLTKPREPKEAKVGKAKAVPSKRAKNGRAVILSDSSSESEEEIERYNRWVAIAVAFAVTVLFLFLFLFLLPLPLLLLLLLKVPNF